MVHDGRSLSFCFAKISRLWSPWQRLNPLNISFFETFETKNQNFEIRFKYYQETYIFVQIRINLWPLLNKSNNILFKNRVISYNPFKSKPRQINCNVSSFRNDFHDSSSNSWSLLNSMTTKTSGKDKITMIRMRPNDGILIKGIVIVITSPGAFELKKRKRRLNQI